MKKVLTVFGFLGVLALLASFGFAQEGEELVEAGRTIGDGLIAIGAGLAIGIGAIGVGLAQAAIGSAGAGTLAERPQAFGQILIYLVIPETLIIFAFVIAFFLYGAI
ncbi:MAG TPA: V-type ATP synthase subunit K [Chloroflexota bacterium]|nr:V-type ATP synthase subunit K [Chloroflexota bacterium]